VDLPRRVGREEPSEESDRVVGSLDWRVDITNADVRDAKQAWLAAHDGGAPEALVDLLYQDYLHLVSAQAQQFAEDLRRR